MSISDNESGVALKVHGRVQGVGFRWWAQRQACALGLRGTVRNCRDGTVEIEMAGSPTAIEEMTERLRQGPVAAHVTRLEELPPPENLPTSFEVGF